MSVMGFKKNKLDGVGGWGELHPSFFLDFWNFFNFAKPLSPESPFFWGCYRSLCRVCAHALGAYNYKHDINLILK